MRERMKTRRKLTLTGFIRILYVKILACWSSVQKLKEQNEIIVHNANGQMEQQQLTTNEKLKIGA